MSTTARPLPRRATAACATALVTLACSGVLTAPASAAAPVEIPLDAGFACDFDVTLVINDDSKRNTRQLTDRNGNAVTLVTGRAESVLLTAESGASVAVPSRGASTRTTTDPSGTTTVEHTGNLVLILFSTDLGGDGLTPTSSTLIAGRTVYTVDPGGVFTVLSVSGRTTDLCAALTS
jgi:hypothetical protein